MNHFFKICLLLFSTLPTLFAQVPPPDPCDDGSQASCQCENSPVLCTIDDLDGFEYAMSSFQHPEDGPEFLCNEEGVPNNPTWFSFVAWCEELALEVELADCSNVCLTGGPCTFLCNLAGNCASGVQIAIYGDCDFNEEVACLVDDCNNEDSKILEMSDLTIGKTYHFVIDGCGGSACDFVRVNVLGTCGLPQIEDWENPLNGSDTVCKNETIRYSADTLEGASRYTWFIDGNELNTTSSPEIDVNWAEEGTFTICVEAGSERCPLTDSPDPLCKTVEVYKPQIDTLLLSTNSTCPGREINMSVIADTGIADLNLALIITDQDSIIRQIDKSTSASFRSESCDTFLVYAYQYREGNEPLPQPGDVFSPPDCSQFCCDLKQKRIAFEDREDPNFLSTPADTFYGCLNAIPALSPLAFEDNCLEPGAINGIQEGLVDFIPGDTILRRWTITDFCGNESKYSQKITIEEDAAVEVSITPTEKEVLFGETIFIEATTNLADEEIENIVWTPITNLDCTDCLRTELEALVEEDYIVTVTDKSGCSDQAIFQLFVEQPDIEIFVPNIFTPNGDGINDGFTLFTNGFIIVEELSIYDRWGKLLFETRNIPPNEPTAGWDGQAKGQMLPNGVYLYSFLIRYPDGTSDYLKGTITLSQ